MKRRRLSVEIKKGAFYLSAGLIIILIISGSFYLLSVSASSQMGYRFKQQEKQQQELLDKNEELKSKVLKAESYSNITEQNTIKTMQPVEKIEFMQSREERLVKKKEPEPIEPAKKPSTLLPQNIKFL